MTRVAGRKWGALVIPSSFDHIHSTASEFHVGIIPRGLSHISFPGLVNWVILFWTFFWTIFFFFFANCADLPSQASSFPQLDLHKTISPDCDHLPPYNTILCLDITQKPHSFPACSNTLLCSIDNFLTIIKPTTYTDLVITYITAFHRTI